MPEPSTSLMFDAGIIPEVRTAVSRTYSALPSALRGQLERAGLWIRVVEGAARVNPDGDSKGQYNSPSMQAVAPNSIPLHARAMPYAFRPQIIVEASLAWMHAVVPASVARTQPGLVRALAARMAAGTLAHETGHAVDSLLAGDTTERATQPGASRFFSRSPTFLTALTADLQRLGWPDQLRSEADRRIVEEVLRGGRWPLGHIAPEVFAELFAVRHTDTERGASPGSFRREVLRLFPESGRVVDAAVSRFAGAFIAPIHARPDFEAAFQPSIPPEFHGVDSESHAGPEPLRPETGRPHRPAHRVPPDGDVTPP